MIRSILIASNLWVGLAVAALCMLSFPDFYSAQAVFYSGALLFGTSAMYSYMRWVKLLQGEALPQNPKLGWSNNLILGLSMTFGAGIIAWSFLQQIFSWQLLFLLTPGLLIALLYPLAFPYPNRYFSSLRSVPMLKMMLIAFAWSWLTYALPQILSGVLWDWRFSAEVILRMILVVGLTIPFDVRDLDLDEKKLRTLPQQMGKEAALDLAQFLVLIYQAWVLASYFLWNLSLAHSIAWLLGLEIGQWIIRRVAKDRSDSYISFWVEAIPLIVLFIFMISQLTIRNF